MRGLDLVRRVSKGGPKIWFSAMRRGRRAHAAERCQGIYAVKPYRVGTAERAPCQCHNVSAAFAHPTVRTERTKGRRHSLLPR